MASLSAGLDEDSVKSRRQREIVLQLRGGGVTSQNQLVKLLRSAGYPATQATVSRDLEELGAVKLRRGGRVIYSLPADGGSLPAETLRRIMAESLLDLESSSNIVVLRTPPGHAGMLASAIDRSEIEGVAGTVAGDDTILVVTKQGVLARRLEKRLRGLAGMLPAGPA